MADQENGYMYVVMGLPVSYICSSCGESVVGVGEGTEHMTHHVDKGEDCSMEQEFDRVILIPGPGHLDMNMVKCFVELTLYTIYYEV